MKLVSNSQSQRQRSIHAWFNLTGEKKSKESDLINDVLPFFGDQLVTSACLDRMLRRRNTFFLCGNFTRNMTFQVYRKEEYDGILKRIFM